MKRVFATFEEWTVQSNNLSFRADGQVYRIAKDYMDISPTKVAKPDDSIELTLVGAPKRVVAIRNISSGVFWQQSLRLIALSLCMRLLSSITLMILSFCLMPTLIGDDSFSTIANTLLGCALLMHTEREARTFLALVRDARTPTSTQMLSQVR